MMLQAGLLLVSACSSLYAVRLALTSPISMRARVRPYQVRRTRNQYR